MTVQDRQSSHSSGAPLWMPTIDVDGIRNDILPNGSKKSSHNNIRKQRQNSLTRKNTKGSMGILEVGSLPMFFSDGSRAIMEDSVSVYTCYR